MFEHKGIFIFSVEQEDSSCFDFFITTPSPEKGVDDGRLKDEDGCSSLS